MDINNIITFIAVATLLVISLGSNGFLIAKTVPLLPLLTSAGGDE
ncbi:hypothetical protein [Agaribacter flavus]|uniref:Uncharacterized protein n=1 Tax=Agaribacter flavus TaxID=1902781 RepID=A0ABV7FNN5_9ALTE